MNSSYIQVLLGGTHKVKCQTHASLVQSLAAPRKPAGTKTVARSSRVNVRFNDSLPEACSASAV